MIGAGVAELVARGTDLRAGLAYGSGLANTPAAFHPAWICPSSRFASRYIRDPSSLSEREQSRQILPPTHNAWRLERRGGSAGKRPRGLRSLVLPALPIISSSSSCQTHRNVIKTFWLRDGLKVVRKDRSVRQLAKDLADVPAGSEHACSRDRAHLPSLVWYTSDRMPTHASHCFSGIPLPGYVVGTGRCLCFFGGIVVVVEGEG